MVSVSWDKTIKIWSITDGQYVTLDAKDGHTKLITAVATITEQLVVSCSEDKTLKLWCVNTGRCIRTSVGYHKRPVHSDYLGAHVKYGQFIFWTHGESSVLAATGQSKYGVIYKLSEREKEEM